jgi:hypothetical protein
MPLRNHFRPPTSIRASWKAFHSGWPMVIVQQLRITLPPGFTAGPRVHIGAFYEIDLSTYDTDEAAQLQSWTPNAGEGGSRRLDSHRPKRGRGGLTR